MIEDYLNDTITIQGVNGGLADRHFGTYHQKIVNTLTSSDTDRKKEHLQLKFNLNESLRINMKRSGPRRSVPVHLTTQLSRVAKAFDRLNRLIGETTINIAS